MQHQTSLSHSMSSKPVPGMNGGAMGPTTGAMSIPPSVGAALMRTASRSSAASMNSGMDDGMAGNMAPGGVGPSGAPLGGGLARSNTRRIYSGDNPAAGAAAKPAPALRRITSERIQPGKGQVMFDMGPAPERDPQQQEGGGGGFRRVMTERNPTGRGPMDGVPVGAMQRTMTGGGDTYKRRVFINGSAVPDSLVEAAEERIGKIEAGKYW